MEEWQALTENTENSKLSECTIICADGSLEPETTASGTCGDSLTWTLDAGLLTISGEGAMDDYSWDSAPWNEYINAILAVTIEDGATSIGNYAFYNCVSLQSVQIPDSVTSIGEEAFQSCGGLTSITIPDGVTSIGGWAFQSCESLKNVTIPNGVTSIEEGTFYGCTGLTGITILDGVTTIGNYAFEGCKGLTGFTVSAGNPAFSSVDGVLFNKARTELVIYPGGKGGYYSIPAGVVSIKNGAFRGCENLTGVMFPDSVTSIGGDVFYQNTKLAGISVDANNPLYSSVDGVLFNKVQTELITYPAGKSGSSYSVPAGVTSIGFAAFSCSSLNEVMMREGVISIGSSAFAGCTSLKEIKIPNSVRDIGYWAFNECSSLTSIAIPEGVTSILSGTFFGCTSLRTITIPVSVTSVGTDAFANCGSLTVVNYTGSEEDWAKILFAPYGCERLKNATVHFDYIAIMAYGTCGENLTWTLNIQGKLLISGEGAMYDYDAEEDAPWCYDYRDNVKSVEIEDGVTSIGEYAFRDCVGLETVTMADTVNSIGLTAFGGCSALKDVSFSGSLTEIEAYAFCDCQKLSSVTFPAGLERIGMAAFAGSGLAQINIEGSGTDWDFFYSTEDGSALYHINLPATVTEVGEGAFCYCSLPYDAPDAFTPSDLNSIGTEAFADSGVRYVWLSDGVTEISDSAFAGCASLEYIFIPYGCNSIGEGAFPPGTTLLGYDESSIAAAYAEENGCIYLPLEDPFGGNG